MQEFMKKVSDAIGGAGLMFFLGFVLAVVAVGATMANNVTAELGTKAQAAQNIKFKAYDDTYVFGDRVVSAIADAKTPSPDKIKVTVKTGDPSGTQTTSVYGYATASSSYSGYSENDPTQNDFINPTATFESELTLNNGVVVEITFTQQ